MRNVTLIFRGVGNNCKHQVLVNIYDNNQLICSRHTKNGSLDVCLDCNKSYLIRASIMSYSLINSFYVDSNTSSLVFNFCINNRYIIFTLRDSYYNLPIESGELILWQSQ